jgi:hypothetical protein
VINRPRILHSEFSSHIVRSRLCPQAKMSSRHGPATSPHSPVRANGGKTLF